MKYVLILCLLFNIGVSQGNSEPLKYYTNHQVSDRIITFSNESYSARYYAFADALSCFTCMQTLVNSANYINGKINAEIILFLHSDNFAANSKYLKKMGWKFLIIDDKIGAYKNLYEIKKNPVCFLSDNFGQIRFIGVPGNTKLFNGKIFEEACSKLSEEKIQNLNSKLELIDEIKIKLDSNTLSSLSKIWYAHYNDNEKLFLFYIFHSKELLIVDTTGNIIKSKTFENFVRPICSSGRIFKDNILFVDYDYEQNSHFYNYNIKTDSIKYVYSVYFSKDSAVLDYDYLQYDDSTIIKPSYLWGRHISSNGKNLNLLHIYNINQNTLINAGRFAQIYDDYPLKNYFKCGLTLDNDNNIIVAQHFSDSLNFYNNNGVLLKSKIIHYDTNYYFNYWREAFSKLDTSSNIEEFKKLSDTVSMLPVNPVLFDKTTGKPAIIYMNKEEFPDGKFDYVYYLNLVDKDSKYDYKFPYYNMPFYINNKIVYCLQHLDSSLTINVFKLK